MPDNYNWGIIGPGKIAHKFATGLAATKRGKLHAVASRSIERAKNFAAQYGAPHYYDNYEALMSAPDLDVIYVATPHSRHCEHTLLCLKHHIPVICEKPIAINALQVKKMINAAQENKTFLMEALWTRFLPTTLKVLELIQNGTIGEVHGVKADFGFKPVFNPESRVYDLNLGGGSLLDIGIYPVFLSQLILGKPNSIKAVAKLGATGVDEDCGILLQYDGNKMAQLHSTILSQTKTEAFIYGEKGTIHLHTFWYKPTTITLLLNGERPQDIHFDFSGNGYNYEAEEVMKCLDKNLLESKILPLSFSWDLINLLDAIRQEIGLVYPVDIG